MPRHARSTAGERRALTSLTGGLATTAPPEPPRGLLKSTQGDWTTFWASDQARLVKAAHLPALVRLFQLRDERTRCYLAVRKTRLVAGSMGQPRRSPLYDVLATLDGEIHRLERDFGLTPKAWVDLGGALGDATRSLADLTADLDDVEREDAGEPPDPRLLVVDGGAGRVPPAPVG